MTIELHVFPPSPRAFKVMALANYLGIEPTLHVLDLIKGDQKSPEYAALNPNMKMPTLCDGDYVLWESNAILQYLAAKRPESRLLPVDEKARLDVTRWQFWDLAHWDPACTVFIFENLVKPVVLKSGEPDPATLVPLQGAVADEVRERLVALGHDDLAAWAGIENLEERLVDGAIDPLVPAQPRATEPAP